MLGLKSKKPAASLEVYMDPVEFSQLTAILESTTPKHVLEWGSGGSTKAILGRCPFIESYTSIEHIAEWHARVSSEISDPRLSLHLVEPDSPIDIAKPTREQVIAWEARAEVEPELMRSYVELPARLGKRYQFVLVDGRARRLCMQAGYQLLDPGGCLVLHDAQREAYHDSLHALGGRVTFLEPWHSGQIALVKKPNP